MTAPLKTTIQDAMKQAMRDRAKTRLATIRLILAALKQKEVDERVELNDTDIIVILDKMLKQRRDSIQQFEAANRQDLAEVEAAEIDVIQTFLPQPLSEDEIKQLIQDAINATNASEPKDMGNVMGHLKPQMQGRADMKTVSQMVRAQLMA